MYPQNPLESDFISLRRHLLSIKDPLQLLSEKLNREEYISIRDDPIVTEHFTTAMSKLEKITSRLAGIVDDLEFIEAILKYPFEYRQVLYIINDEIYDRLVFISEL
jgi:hypothetical protein